jgi:DNA-binding transcriptional MerR regulator
LRIKDVAAQSGFAQATLRYYERIGLLPQADRSSAGYRMYDERMLERLAFVARAKRLGCTLDEIAELTAAWEGGRCGPVQDELRRLVASKRHAADVQIRESMKFASDLEAAAAALESHRPEGACDEGCGCVTAPVAADMAAAVQSVSWSPKAQRDGGAPIACTLGAASRAGRIEEWQSLLGHVAGREPLDGGVRNVFAPSVPMAELMRLVAAEQNCCQFLTFAVTVDRRGVALEVRAPEEGRAIVSALFGAP